MNATDVAEARERPAPPPAAGSAAGRDKPGQGMAGLLRPHLGSFAAVVTLQVIGAVAGLAPLLAVAELGRGLLSPGTVDHGHVRIVVIAGAAGLLVHCVTSGSATGFVGSAPSFMAGVKPTLPRSGTGKAGSPQGDPGITQRRVGRIPDRWDADDNNHHVPYPSVSGE